MAGAPVEAPGKIGLLPSVGHPSVYYHPSGGLVTLVHRDDYTTAGSVKELRWFKKMLGEAYEIKTQLIGPVGTRQAKC